MAGARSLDRNPVHLGRGGRACDEPEFTGGAWYEAYVTRHAADGTEGRLVTIHSFTADWDAWEMHPHGDEVVVCLSGRLVLLQECAGVHSAPVELGPGEYAINPAGTWHTADIAAAATALFITAGWGTQHKPRREVAAR